MQFQQATEGDFQIYAGALEAPQGDGYTAAVIVSLGGRDAWRDERMAGGHRWPNAQEALAYAVRYARKVIRHEPESLRV